MPKATKPKKELVELLLVLKELDRGEGASFTEIVGKAPMSRATVWRKLREGVKLGLVDLYVSPSLTSKLLKFLEKLNLLLYVLDA